MRTLESLQFDNSYARLPEAFHRRVAPLPLKHPRLACFNAEVAELLDLDPREAERPEFVAYLGGERPLPGSDPVAMAYSGHQFGHYVPQLGDGRALLLGEVVNGRGERWDLHLKGAGETPYSRMGDGRAVLRSSIREYLCGEAMYGLGIPTTRALCLIASDEKVARERMERGAMLLRVAPSHLRFGSFELFYYQADFSALERLADYAIGHHFPHLLGTAERYSGLLREVVERTAHLMAQWQLVGFAHGVMNTDNMSLLGLTLDYGPFGFLDAFDPGFICNHSDHSGRYAFQRQPYIGLWNLSRFAQALLPLLEGEPEAAAEQANAILGEYDHHFSRAYGRGMGAKLGLQEQREGDAGLAVELLELLAAEGVDYSGLFRDLATFDPTAGAANATLRAWFRDGAGFDAWAQRYAARLQSEGRDGAARAAQMQRVNPRYVLRNYLAQLAIEQAERHDFSELKRLAQLLRDPFTEQVGAERYAAPPPEWGRRLVISCSS